MKLQQATKYVDILVPCDCGAEILRIEQYLDRDDKSVDICFYTLDWYTLQHNWWGTLKERLAIMWQIFRGKQYCFSGIILTRKEQVLAFKKAVAELDEDLPF